MSMEIADGRQAGGGEIALRGRWLMRLTKRKLIGIVLCFDLMLLWSIGLATLLANAGAAALTGPPALGAVISIPLVTIYLLQRLWGYTIASLGAFARQSRLLLVALLGAFVLVMGFGFVLGENVMPYRAWLIAWFGFSLPLLILFRRLLALIVAAAERKGELARRAVIVGGGRACEDLLARFAKTGERAIEILGIFDDRGEDRSPDQVGRYRKIGTFDELERYCRDHYVDLLIVALPASAEERILHLMRQLWVLPIDVRIAAHSAKLKLAKRAYSYIGDVPFLAIFDRPLSDWNAAVKAIFDRVFGLFALVLLSPLMLATAIAVKLDSKGPVFFRQKRHGFNNEIIHVFKFRSMYAEMADPNAAKQVTKGDPRVTRVGRFIRRTSIDELPQLFNVLRGELSLVGPRPHAIETKAGNALYQDAVNGYFARHRMRPGITGWAQINGWRGETDTLEKIERRVEHDLYYIEHWSLPFDLYILAMTPFSLFNGKNAY